ncbi:MAG: ABC transporter ATP-binding protein [candidate division NC10 bacterium]|nr:ABC transporter ATP-binding protein [candidate division NC10 bacterium]
MSVEQVQSPENLETRGTDDRAVAVEGLRHRYGEREALAGVSLCVRRKEIFGLLGPNGGGKTTMFRVLSTLLVPTAGTVQIFRHDIVREAHHVRTHLGVVFQQPSLDPKLTVLENIRHHGHLYGLSGAPLRQRAERLLGRLGLADRARDGVETLSGGLQRRVELAKALVHQPDLLLLDEPSTGLDPAARREFVAYLHQLREQEEVTVALTTHMMDEAERCDRVAILHHGRLAALGTPDELKAKLGGDVVVIHSPVARALQGKIEERFGCRGVLVGETLRLEVPKGHIFLHDVVEAFSAEIQSVSFGKPTLEDVFIHLTGHALAGDDPEDEARRR